MTAMTPDPLDRWLLGGAHTVKGVTMGTESPLVGLWPGVLIELNLNIKNITVNYNLLPELLVRRGLTRVRSLNSPAFPNGRPTWQVRLPARGSSRETGVWAPGGHGQRFFWQVITPLPMQRPDWVLAVRERDWRCAIWLTTGTGDLSMMQEPAECAAGMQAAADDGDLYSTVATVI
jgi:hypothetical protein